MQQITGAIGSPETPVTTVNRGDIVTMRIDALNSGNALTGGALTDPLPAGMVLAPTPNPRASTSCGGSIAFTAVAGASTFIYSGAQVPAAVGPTAGECAVYVDVQVPLQTSTPANTNVTLDNTIPASTGVGTGFRATDSVTSATIVNTTPATRSITVRSLANLGVAKSFSPSTFLMGEQSEIRIVLTNSNSVPVGLTQLTETLPGNVVALGTSAPNLEVLTAAGGGQCGSATAAASGTSGSTTISFSNFTLGANSSCTVVWRVRGAASDGATNTTAPANNTVPANSVLNDRGLPSGAASAAATVQSPLTPSKAFSPTSAAANQPITMTISLQNRSSTQALSSVNFSDSFPSGVTLLNAAINSSNCGSPSFTPASPSGGETSLAMTGASIAAGATCTITAQVQANNDGSYTNTIPQVGYTSNNTDVGTRNSGPASATVTVYDQIALEKYAKDPRSPASGPSASDAGNVAPGNLIRYVLVVNNYSSGVLNNISVSDPLASASGAQITFESSPAPIFGGGCGGSPTVASSNGASTASFTNISIAAGSTANPTTCVIEFYARVPANWPVGTAITNNTSGSPVNVNTGGANLVQNQSPTSNPAVSPFTFSKGTAVASVFQGDSTTVTVTLNNDNFVNMTNVGFTDAPIFGATGANEVRLASPVNPSTTCSGTPTYTATAGSTSFQVSGLTVPARSSCTVSFRVRGVVPGNYTNTIPANNVSGVVSVNGEAPRTVNPPSAATAPLAVTSVISASKSFSPASVAATGGVSRVTISVQNVGSQVLTGLRVVDPLPSSLVIANPANASTTCSGPTSITATPGASSVTLQGATLFGSSTCLLQFDVVTNGTGGTAASVNTIPSNNITADNDVFNVSPVSGTLNKLGVGTSALSVTKSFSPASLNSVGQVSRLQVTVSNPAGGAANLTNLSLTDNLPAGMVVAAVPAPSTTCQGGIVTASAGGTTVRLNGGTLAANASCVFEANVTLVSAGTANNTIPANAVTNDQNVTNPQAFTANLQTQASLGVEKSFSPTAVAVGTPARLTIRLINSQAVALNLMGLVDNLPSGLVPATPAGATTTCAGGAVTTSTTQVTLVNGSLPAASAGVSSVCEVSLNVVSSANGSYTNTIPIGGVTATDQNGTAVQNQAPTTAVLNVRSAAGVSKAFSPTSVRVGVPTTLTITINNPNAIALTGVILSDNLPAGSSVAPTPNASTTCTNGFVNAAAGSALVRLTGATVAATSSCTITVDVVSNTPGAYNNRIPDGALISDQGVTNSAPTTSSFTTFNPPTLGKEFIPVQIGSGGTSKLRIVLLNSNSAALTLTADLVDTLPAGLALGTPALDTTTTDTQGLARCASVAASNGGTTITKANGSTIPAGGCSIWANVTGTNVGQYTNSIPAGGLQTNGGPNPLPGNATLAISTLNSIAGKIYRDNNNNGTPEATDVPLAGQTVELLDNTGTVIRTAVTDSLGNYAFLELPNGTYSVREPTQPVGTVNGITSAGSNGGTPTGLATTPSQISGIALSGGQNATGYNFGEIALSSISGRVFLDNNNNGTQQAGDPGLNGVTLTLTGTNDLGAITPITITTNADGTYTFPNLRPGTYTITQPTQPSNTANGITTPGTGASTAGTATAVGTVPSAISGIVLAPSQTAIDYNFAEVPAVGISGTVYVDRDRNNAFDPADTGRIPGVTLQLFPASQCSGSPATCTGTPIGTTTTDANGNYSFTNVSAGGNYVIVQTQPPGYGNGNANGVAGSNSISITNLPANGLGGNNFGEIAGSIAGSVYFDANNDGVRQGGESGIAGVTMTLTGTSVGGATITRTAITNGTGNYSFPDLPQGTYTVTEQSTQPSVSIGGSNTTTQNGITTAGTIGGTTVGTATPVTTTPSAVSNIVLPLANIAAPGNADSINNNFGEFVPASVSGTVWYDIGGTQRQLDSGDQRLAGWTVEIINPALPANSPPVRTVTTGPDGAWSVNGLNPQTEYLIRYRDPQSNIVWGVPVSGETGSPPVACLTNNPGNAQRSSCVENGAGSQLRFVLQPGDNLVQQSLPVDPSGVVYDAVSRQPVPGSIVTLAPTGACAGWNPSTHIVGAGLGGYTINGNAISMTVGSLGAYQFLLAATAPASCPFGLTVTPPPTHRAPSELIPGSTTPLLAPPAPGNVFVQPQPVPPTGNQSTIWYPTFTVGSGTQGILHNHIPLDPLTLQGISIVKTGSVRELEVGDSMVYQITVRNSSSFSRPTLFIDDRLPAGFRYITGTAQVRVGTSGAFTSIADPVGGVGPNLSFSVGALPANGEVTLVYRVRAGVGSQQGDGINRAQGRVRPGVTCAASPGDCTGEARWRVRITPGVFTTDACIVGKIFVDCNNNHVQDREELGIPGVRLYLQDGTFLISDSEGKYSFCGLKPKTHVLKVDPTTLPRGSRLTTTSNRNAGDANSLFLDLKNGELHRADFAEGSCSNTVLEQVKARRTQGEVGAQQTEKKGGQPLRFKGKAPNYPQQGTDGADQQPAVKPRVNDSPTRTKETQHENDVPTHQLPMNRDNKQQGGANVR